MRIERCRKCVLQKSDRQSTTRCSLLRNELQMHAEVRVQASTDCRVRKSHLMQCKTTWFNLFSATSRRSRGALNLNCGQSRADGTVRATEHAPGTTDHAGLHARRIHPRSRHCVRMASVDGNDTTCMVDGVRSDSRFRTRRRCDLAEDRRITFCDPEDPKSRCGPLLPASSVRRYLRNGSFMKAGSSANAASSADRPSRFCRGPPP